jgi:hypothetical protein
MSDNIELKDAFLGISDPNLNVLGEYLACRERVSVVWDLFWNANGQFFSRIIVSRRKRRRDDENAEQRRNANIEDEDAEPDGTGRETKRRRHDLTRCGMRTFYEKYLAHKNRLTLEKAAESNDEQNSHNENSDNDISVDE